MLNLNLLPIGIASLTGVALMMVRKILRRSIATCECISVKPKHAVITGGTSGIGLATAFELARRGWSLVLTCRNLQVGAHVCQQIITSTGNHKVKLEYLDLNNLKSIKSFANVVDHLDILINNAGTMAGSPKLSGAIPNTDTNMMVNCLGSAFLYELLRLKMIQAADKRPRVVFVSSAMASRGELTPENPFTPLPIWTYQKSYANSKQALNLYAREIYNRDKDAIDVFCCVTGGMVNTHLNREIVEEFSAPIRWLINTISSIILKNPYEGCQSIVHCAVSEDVYGAHLQDKIQGRINGSGLLYRNCMPMEWPASSSLGSLSTTVYLEALKLFEKHFP